jgi:nitrate reductase assembly molybdenum cofactor insertion protein NarJ
MKNDDKRKKLQHFGREYLARLRAMAPAEKTALYARLKDVETHAMEAEYRELFDKSKRGELVSMEQLMRELGMEIDDEGESA